ncbi:MAG: hypothetical protein C4560_10400 [Nitrospiraceae bacterium]|nr:MAG: hypothetical protein C4560_10400 [Nitrospiraceae bacterium]
MALDVSVHKGRADKPVVIFIHGLGMDKSLWLDPLETRVFAKNIPAKFLAAGPPRTSSAPNHNKFTLGDVPEKMDGLWDELKTGGYNLVCWSQKRPVGPIGIAVKELAEIMSIAKKSFPQNPIVLIGHSRGGLISRKFMEGDIRGIKTLITISTPHSGSSLARLGKYLRPLAAALKTVLPDNTRTVSEVVKRLNEFIEGNAARELLPGSDFLKGLRDSPAKGVSYFSFGGTRTELFTLYAWKKRDGKISPEPFLTIPDSLLSLLPSSVLPDELTPGKGDGLVSAKSSVLPWARRHHNVPANHISVLWDRKIIGAVAEILEGV